MYLREQHVGIKVVASLKFFFLFIFFYLQTMSICKHWPRAHRYPCDNAPSTGVACNSPEIVTVGEDGRIIVFRADQEGVVRVIGEKNIKLLYRTEHYRLKIISH